MTRIGTHVVPGSEATTRRDQHAAATLATAIRKPLDALDAAAEEAANGRLGGAKLGLLVAANRLIEAFEAVDAEFARRYGTCTAGCLERQDDRRGADAHNVSGQMGPSTC
jgi:hypothetical protein